MIDGIVGIFVGVGFMLGALALITCYFDWKADKKESKTYEDNNV